jgi:uncharacterized membrane protein YjjP (DUF1212 family)
MQSGGNTKRVISCVNRFADALDLKSHALISHKSIIMTITDLETKTHYTEVTQIPSYQNNFFKLSEVSSASWDAVDFYWNFEQIKNKIEQIKQKKTYNKSLVWFSVSLAGASFARLFGGDYMNMLVSFIATLAGLFVLHQSNKFIDNRYVRTYLASFTASTLAGVSVLQNWGNKPEIAMATAVLFLIPGVPLINSFNDLYNNHILNGTVRFISGIMIVLSIGLGMISAMVLLNINVLN